LTFWRFTNLIIIIIIIITAGNKNVKTFPSPTLCGMVWDQHQALHAHPSRFGTPKVFLDLIGGFGARGSKNLRTISLLQFQPVNALFINQSEI